MLSGLEIVEQMRKGNIVIDPFYPDQLNPSSYNLCLGDTLLVYRRPPWWRRAWMRLRGRPWCLDMKADNPAEEVTIPEGGYVLRPGVLYLGVTREYTETRNLVPMLEGRSSVGRLGAFVHVCAGFGDPEYANHWTLEIVVVQPLRVYAGVEICQIAYDSLEGAYRPYAGKYAVRNTRPTASRMYLDFAKERMRNAPAKPQA